jgi:hypothetical protein
MSAGEQSVPVIGEVERFAPESGDTFVESVTAKQSYVQNRDFSLFHRYDFAV